MCWIADPRKKECRVRLWILRDKGYAESFSLKLFGNKMLIIGLGE